MIKIMLVAGSIVIPLLMFYIQTRWSRLQTIYNVLALFSLLIAANIATTSIYQVIIDNEIFMTTIHGLFLNPFFLLTGSIVGLYTIYRFILLTVKEW